MKMTKQLLPHGQGTVLAKPSSQPLILDVDADGQVQDVHENVGDFLTDAVDGIFSSENEKEASMTKLQKDTNAKHSADLTYLIEQKTRILAKIDQEILSEQVRMKKYTALESARQAAIDRAKAQYGSKADVRAIMAYYDGMAAAIDPKANGIGDVLSLSLDNALHAKDGQVGILMPNGSIRMMDTDIAKLLSSNGKQELKDQLKREDSRISDSDVDAAADLFEKEIRDRLSDLEELMTANVERAMKFKPMAEAAAMPDEAQKERNLPDIAKEYGYLQRLPDGNRPLPDALYSRTFYDEMAKNGRTYGL